MTTETQDHPANRAKIISLIPRRDRAHFPALSLVEAYWEGLRNGRPMPARAEIDPRAISGALQHAFILEQIAPGMARIRLAGQHLNELMGMEVRGMPLSALFLPEARGLLRDSLESCFSAPASLRFTLAGDTGFTRPALEAQMYLAPLRDQDGRPTRLLGALQSTGRIGRAPRRFAVRAVRVNALMEAPGASPRAAPGPASRPARPIRPAQQHRPELRLVYSADN